MESKRSSIYQGGTMQTYAITYSYPTSDRYYRGQRGERIAAKNEQDAIARIRRGEGLYGRCPDAQIVRCKLSAKQPSAQ